jgi:hypothetical protein
VASADEPDELYDERKQLLTTAVIDGKGSIHANDQKVAAALVAKGYGWLRLEGLSALILLGFVAAVAATQVSLPL